MNCRVTWMRLVTQLEKSGKKSAEIRALLNPLRQVAVKVVGDESGTHIVDECAISLLLYFLDKEVIPKTLPSLGFDRVDPSVAKEALKVSL